MLTVVQFNQTGDSPNGSPWKNSLYTRTLRKIGFIDNRIQLEPPPKAGEHWLVKVVRENSSTNSKGCLILQPIRKIDESELTPLLHGEYTVTVQDDIIILNPPDPKKFWVLRPRAKDSLIRSGDANVIVINHGGTLWSRRRPADDVLRSATQSLRPRS